MATNNLEGLYGVRAELNARGIDNSRIGWNQNTGYVTIDGQNFLKPPTVEKGVSYADPTQFDQAYNVWNNQQKLTNTQKQYDQMINNPVTNPYDQKVSDVLSQFYNMINNPTPYDPYSSDEYKAYQAQAQRSAQQSIRAAQEAMGAANFGRSTNLAERAQGIQNQANEYLELQVIPQLRAAHQQQQQQQLANLGAYLEVLSGQQGLFDTRTQRGMDNTLQYLQLLNNQRNQFADEQYRTGRDAVSDNQWQQSFDRNVYESDRDFALQQERYRVADEQWKQQFGLSLAQVTGYFPDGTPTSDQQQRELANLWTVADQTGTIPNELAEMYGLPRGTQTRDAKEFAAQLAIQQQNANATSMNAQTNRMQEERLARSANSNDTKLSSKESYNNYNILLEDMQKAGSRSRAMQLLQLNAEYLNDSDYRKMMDYINNLYQ